MTIEFSGETTCGELVQEQPDNMTPRPNLLAANIATAVMLIIILLVIWSLDESGSDGEEGGS